MKQTRFRTRMVPCDPQSLERGVRQMLADKVSGNLVGMWLLVAEHLRLGTWDLLRGWTGQPTERVEPRMAMQLVNEAALCTTGMRNGRTIWPRVGFELANGLPFVANDVAIHDLLNEHAVKDAIHLQIALGKIRQVGGDFHGKVLAIDPHRVLSYSQRQMRRHAKNAVTKPTKISQTFWLLDADTHQPVAFTTATSSRSVTQATPELLDIASEILAPQQVPALVLADTEHYSAELIDDVAQREGFELLVSMSNHKSMYESLTQIAPEKFKRQWAGFATLIQPYKMKRASGSRTYFQYVQRSGERPEDWRYKAFLSTSMDDEVTGITQEFPKRWHVEEFFNANQALGWQRAGTQNLNIRYGQMTMALIAQAAIHQLRKRIGKPVASWDSKHLAKDLFLGLDGDVRVTHDTIVVTYYNARTADALRRHYENLPAQLSRANINPQIPWLYDFKLDFRFR